MPSAAMPRRTQACIVSQIRSMPSRDNFYGRLRRIAGDQGALVLQHQLADGEFVGVGGGQQFRRVVERKRNLPLLHGGGSIGSVFGDEAAADGEERALAEDSADRVECLETKAVGMLGERAGGKHEVLSEDEVAWFFKGDAPHAGKVEALRRANLGNGRVDGRGIDGGRLVTRQTQ